MIEVRLLNILIAKSRRGVDRYQVHMRAGLTVQDVVEDAGLEQKWVQIILVNGRPARLASTLEDADKVVLGAAIAGG